MKIIPKNFEIPEGLSPEGEKAWELVTTFFVENKMTDTGGCKTFYSPKEWQEKGNRYGTKSVLIVVYDGGDVSKVCNIDKENYDLNEHFCKFMNKFGYSFEECTCWYGAIYAD